MTDQEKRELLDNVEESCWLTLKKLPNDATVVKDLLTAIEIAKEMRYDYQEIEGEEDEE